jgi:L-fuconolactonase
VAGLNKRFEGRDEEIVEPEIRIIDAHHHLFDRPQARYLFDDYLADVGAGHDIAASVYVETLAMARPDGPPIMRPVGEVEFANGVAAMSASGRYGPCRVAAGIVGFADLSQGDAVAELLDRSLSTSPDRFRGIRQLTMDHPDPATWRFVTNPPPAGLLEHPAFGHGFRHLAPRGLSFDAAVFHHQLPDLAALAGRHPDTTIALNHMGHAMALDMDASARSDVFVSWRAGLLELAQHPNVVCKVGGLGLPFWGFGFENRADPLGSAEVATAWRPYVETAIEAFGVDRCMMESNFPTDGRSCGWVPLWNALKLAVAGSSSEEKAALFHGTAARVYRLGSALSAN